MKDAGYGVGWTERDLVWRMMLCLIEPVFVNSYTYYGGSIEASV